jgi:hypothetical protein
MTHGGEGALDRVCGAQMHPVLGRVVREREQLVEVVGDLRDGFGVLGAVRGLELLDHLQGVGLVLGVPDLGEVLLRTEVRGLGQRPQNVGDLMEPAALLAGLWEHLAQRPPEPNAPSPAVRTGAHAAAFAVA